MGILLLLLLLPLLQPVSGSPHVVVNEIMYAPARGEPEWVEVFNAGEDTVELAGWQLGDALSRHVLPPGMLAPGEVAVLTRDGPALAGSRGTIPSLVLQVAGFPALNNTGDAVVLCDQGGRTVDSVAYRPSWGGLDGRSLERRDPGAPPCDQGSWSVSQDSSGATPGRGNSCRRLPHDLALAWATAAIEAGRVRVECMVRNEGLLQATEVNAVLLQLEGGPPLAEARGGPLDRGDSSLLRLFWDHPRAGLFSGLVQVRDSQDARPWNNAASVSAAVPFPSKAMVINEIMARPVPGGVEYVELLNWGEGEVDLRSWWIHDGRLSADRSPVGMLPSCRVAPGGFLVVVTDSSAPYPGLREAGRLVVLRKDAMTLNDEGDDCVLHDPSGAVIDSVPYRAAWHSPAVADPQGRSLERIRPELGSSDPRAWTSSVAGGTPGARNSVYAQSLPAASRLSCSPNPFSPDGDGRDDAVLIRFGLPATVSTLSITLYDIRGRKIRHLRDHEPCGAEGVIAWDGYDDNGVRAPVGIYIILLEAASGDGATQCGVRGTVVLALPL
jgi:hypothetical protein